MRLDKLLFEKKLASSRTRAQAMIREGKIALGGVVVSDPAKDISDDAIPTLLGQEFPWVSRGALKLIAGLDYFGIDPHGKIAVDLGASTGGFTEVLLSRGVKQVYAVDVGHGELHERLRGEERVIVMENVDARSLNREQFADGISLVVGDLSFISLIPILPVIFQLLLQNEDALLLVKPQFEAGKGKTKKGIVKDETVRRKALENIILTAEEIGFQVFGTIESPIKGGSGNIEYLVHLKK